MGSAKFLLFFSVFVFLSSGFVFANHVTNDGFTLCTETDGGQNVNVRSATTGHSPTSTTQVITGTDTCGYSNTISEYYCLFPEQYDYYRGHGYVSIAVSTCPTGTTCIEGACVASSSGGGGGSGGTDSNTSTGGSGGGGSGGSGGAAGVEEVKCVFKGSSAEQKCYTTTDSAVQASCSGAGTCVAVASGPIGTKLTWKSTCGGYAYTVIDGSSEYAEFNCYSQPETVSEQVKCVFGNSGTEQECNATDFTGQRFSCKGIGSCVADVKGTKGTSLTWKSSCGGYAYTVVDGSNEYAEFKCAGPEPACSDTANGLNSSARGTVTNKYLVSDTDACLPLTEPAGKQVAVAEYYCNKAGATGKEIYECPNGCKDGACVIYTKEIVSEQVKCVFSGSSVTEKCYSEKGSCSGKGTCVVDVKGVKGQEVTWKSSCGGYAYTKMDGENEYAEFGCAGSEPVVVSEQVKCVFNNSDKEEKCSGTVDGTGERFGCSGVGDLVAVQGVGACVADVKGPKGAKVSWESSCGGSAVTLLDGDSEYANFYCGGSTGIVVQTGQEFRLKGGGGAVSIQMDGMPVAKAVFGGLRPIPVVGGGNSAGLAVKVTFNDGTGDRTESINAGGKAVFGKFTVYFLSIAIGEKQDLAPVYGVFRVDEAEEPSGQEFNWVFQKGWNLISVPATSMLAVKDNCKFEGEGPQFVFFYYNKEENRYVRFDRAGDLKPGYAFWAHNKGSACEKKIRIEEPVPLSSLQRLGVGWNFVAVVPGMLGSKITELGDCSIKRVYSYNSAAAKWQGALNSTINPSGLGMGLLAWASQECSLAGDGINPPPLPEEYGAGSGGGGGGA